MLDVLMWILEDLNDKDFCKKKRNGSINKYLNRLDLKRHCKISFILRNSASYKYQCIKPDDKNKKYRNENGKVITKPPNVCANLLSNLEYKRIKNFKYTEDPYDNLRMQRKK